MKSVIVESKSVCLPPPLESLPRGVNRCVHTPRLEPLSSARLLGHEPLQVSGPELGELLPEQHTGLSPLSLQIALLGL